MRLLAVAALAVACAAHAQDAADFPNRPIRIITPSAPGGTLDILSRIISERMSADWGQSVIVDNKPGVGGILGTELAARARPDGYTIVDVISSHVVHKDLVKDLPFDALRDFEPVILLARTPLALVVTPTFPAANAKEFVAYAKANPGKLSYGASGIGSAVHLTMELFKEQARIEDVQHVPYKGGAPALQDLLGGHIQVLMSGLYTASEALKAGQIRALFVTSAKRSPLFPDVPTLAESGYPSLIADEWFGILAPAGTPKPIVDKLNAEITQIFTSPQVRARTDKLGIEFIGSTPSEFRSFLASETTRWHAVIQRVGIKPE